MFIEFVQQQWMLFILMFAILALLFLDPIRRRAGGVQTVTSNDALRLLQNEKTVVIDVSEEAEYNQGHIAGAISSPASKLDKDLDRLGTHKDRDVIVVCRTGQRSAKAAGQLAKAGFTSVSTLQGGTTAWTKDNLPLEKS